MCWPNPVISREPSCSCSALLPPTSAVGARPGLWVLRLNNSLKGSLYRLVSMYRKYMYLNQYST